MERVSKMTDKDRQQKLVKEFKKIYGTGDAKKIRCFSSPGRLELSGNHTDHQGGVVLTGTADLDIIACVSENNTDRIEIFSKGYDPVSIDCKDKDIYPEEKNKTAALVRGMLKSISDKGYEIKGFDMYAESDLPAGLGMSSSACFEVLVGTVMNELFCDGKLSKEEIAYCAVYAENEYFGKPCGLMDQMACLTGGINLFDFRDPDKPLIENISFDFKAAGLDIVVTDTGTHHADMAEEFNAIPEEMFSVANALGGARLCDIDESVFYRELPELRKTTGDRAVLRALHWYDEIKRVRNEKKALEENDTQKFTEIVRACGRSSFMYLQNIDNYKDSKYQPVAIALAAADHMLSGRGAVRIQGGGFAGSIIAFVPEDMTPDFIKKMDSFLKEGSCRRVSIRECGVYEISI